MEEQKRVSEDFVDNIIWGDSDPGEDKDETERLLTNFKQEWGGFFAGGELKENVTQIFWHIADLQRQRLRRKNVKLSFAAERRKYTEEDPVRRKNITGRQYLVTEIREDIAADRVYSRDGRELLKIRDRELAHYTLLAARNEGEGTVICPACGMPAARESLLNGCDACGTKFTVNDLGQRVAGFSLRHDVDMQYKQLDRGVDRLEKRTEKFMSMAVLVVFGAVMLLAGPLLVMAVGWLGMLLAAGVIYLVLSAMASSLFNSYGGQGFGMMRGCGRLLIAGNGETEGRTKQQENRDRQMEASIRETDPLFNIEVFYNGLENKLASVVYADNAPTMNAFGAPGTNLAALLTECRDYIYMEMAEANIDKHEYAAGKRIASVSGKLKLIKADDYGAKKLERYFKVVLEKDEDCFTEEIFTPAVMHCQGCGASVSLLDGRYCQYCGREIDIEKYDWAIKELAIYRDKFRI
ncbi:MAG: hypothetical protein Q4D07_03985 [Selenomonadaceae bacterium]|nr:hypothetical protein [Selenomonadaceae bacterium]